MLRETAEKCILTFSKKQNTILDAQQMAHIHGKDVARRDRRSANRCMSLCCVCRDWMRKSLEGHCGGILAVKEDIT